MVTPLTHAMWVGGSLFLILLGVLVFGARPGATLNRVGGALFVLRGTSDLFYEFMRDAPTAADALLAHRVANWYDWPTLFLTLCFLHLVVTPPRSPAPRRVVLALGAVFTAALMAAFVLAPELFAGGAVGGPGSYYVVDPVGSQVFSLLTAATQVGAIVVAAAYVGSADHTLLQRRRAALTGLAFGLLVAQNGLGVFGIEIGAIPDPANLRRDETFAPLLSLVRGLVYGAGFLALLVGLRRFADAFEGSGRTAVLAAGGAVLAVGLVEAVHTAVSANFGTTFLPPYESPTTRVPFVVLSGACLALVMVRFGMAGSRAPALQRMAAASQLAMVAALALLPVGIFMALTGADSLVLGLAVLVTLGALTLSPSPFRAAMGALRRLVSVGPGEHAAVGERARLYTQALRERAAALGGTPPASDGKLRALRQELGLTGPDHDLLVEAARTGTGSELLLGRYRVERELGRGAFGAAHLATDAATGQKVVLKRFHASWVEQRALAEARALTSVRHPRVVPLLAVERVADEAFLVLAYAAGGTAEALLDRVGPLPPARAVALAKETLEGLGAIHAAGLAHGDVKLSNILLDDEGRALLGDLGSARAIQRAEGDLTLTSSPVLGSYSTLAPEVLRGGRRSAQADIYATGAVLYRLLTGRHYVALEGQGPVAATEAILHAPPRLPHRRVPAHLEPVIARALEKTPERRFPSAEAMRAALEAGPAGARTASPRAKSGRRGRGHPAAG